MFMTIIEVIAFIILSLGAIFIIGILCSNSVNSNSARKISADDFNKIAVALGAIATVAWGLFTYGALEQRDKAKAELIDLKNRIKIQNQPHLKLKLRL